MGKNYEALVSNRIFVGGVDGVEDLLANEKIDVIFDLRVTLKDHPAENLRVHQPIADESPSQDKSIKKVVDEVVKAYNEGKNVYFHCTSGRGRAGTLAVATLMELGLAETVEEAEGKAKAIRPKIDVKPDQKAALDKIYNG
ncbi:dual specificity protein phosphatase family protein [Psychrobacillus sp.]|uniref:protein-tyrosine phosphatase family protein n=1 Tax=Psychrobacillus sp. TaxID=1871623 RepID=UPI0028BDC3EE|nr:dual specificity protein phosphatase family protein [Psychrobacillus sp.]